MAKKIDLELYEQRLEAKVPKTHRKFQQEASETVYTVSGNKTTRKKLMKYIIQKQEEEMEREALENKRRGYCHLCGRPRTTMMECEADCYRINDMKTGSTTYWYRKGQRYQEDKVKRVVKDSMAELLSEYGISALA